MDSTGEFTMCKKRKLNSASKKTTYPCPNKAIHTLKGDPSNKINIDIANKKGDPSNNLNINIAHKNSNSGDKIGINIAKKNW